MLKGSFCAVNEVNILAHLSCYIKTHWTEKLAKYINVSFIALEVQDQGMARALTLLPRCCPECCVLSSYGREPTGTSMTGTNNPMTFLL